MPAVQSQPQQLSQALQAIQASLYILISHYKPYIKMIVLSIFIYLFYKLGHLSVKDEVLNQKQQLSTLIDRRISVKVQIPKKIQKIRKSNKTILVLAILSLIAYGFAYYSNYKPIVKNSTIIIILFTGFIVFILGSLNIYKFYLNRKYRQADNLQRVITKKLNQFINSLGPKVTAILKHHLCKQKSQKLYSSAHINQCSKNDCKELRGLYKARNDSIATMTEQVINFQWCSICKKRAAFDQYLPFQFKQYHHKSQNQEEEVKERLYYLLQGLQRMRKWLSQTSPCNCSKLYWSMSTKHIIAYKKAQKSNSNLIKELQSKHR